MICEGCSANKGKVYTSAVKGRREHGICTDCIWQYYPETVNPMSGALHPCWKTVIPA